MAASARRARLMVPSSLGSPGAGGLGPTSGQVDFAGISAKWFEGGLSPAADGSLERGLGTLLYGTTKSTASPASDLGRYRQAQARYGARGGRWGVRWPLHHDVRRQRAVSGKFSVANLPRSIAAVS